MTDHHNTLEVISLVLVHAAIAYGKVSVAAARLDTLLKIAFWCFELEKLPTAIYCCCAVSIAHIVGGLVAKEYTGFEA